MSPGLLLAAVPKEDPLDSIAPHPFDQGTAESPRRQTGLGWEEFFHWFTHYTGAAQGCGCPPMLTQD